MLPEDLCMVQKKYDVKVLGQPFTIGKGQALNVAGASLGLALRVGTGALVVGYKTSLADRNESTYSRANISGKMLLETSV
jgi:hypothetical protein